MGSRHCTCCPLNHDDKHNVSDKHNASDKDNVLDSGFEWTEFHLFVISCFNASWGLPVTPSSRAAPSWAAPNGDLLTGTKSLASQ